MNANHIIIIAPNPYPSHPIAASSFTRPGIGNGGHQDWDHVRVRNGAHLFWWLHFSTADSNATINPKRPLAIWLQGGPGASSTGYGNFAEIGPLDIHLKPRPHTWIKDMHVLFVDAPVGAGFSYAETPDTFSTTDRECADDLVRLMAGFYVRHPEFRATPVHIFAESYGGKLAMDWALAWRRAATKRAGDLPRTLRSVTSVDGWIAPVASMKAWAPLLLSTGFVDGAGAARIAAATAKAEQLCEAGEWTEATRQWGYTERIVLVESDGVDFYNIMSDRFVGEYRPDDAEDSRALVANVTTARRWSRLVGENEDQAQLEEEQMYALLVKRTQSRSATAMLESTREVENEDDILDALMNGPVHQALNISKHIVWGEQSSAAFYAMRDAFMRPARETVEALLADSAGLNDDADDADGAWPDGGIRVNVLNGQLDLIVATEGTSSWVHDLRWPGSEAFKRALRERLVRQPSGRVEGWTKRHGRLAYYVMKRSGHMVPADNPDGMDELLRRVTKYDEVL